MGRASREDPLKVFRYRIEVDGFQRAGFSEVTGLERETDVVEYREGGSNETPQKSAGLSKYPDVTFKRGQLANSTAGGDSDLEDWANQVHNVASGGNGENYRREISIVQMSAENVPVKRWNITEAWPRRVKPFSDLNASSSDNSIEEMVIAHEGYKSVRV